MMINNRLIRSRRKLTLFACSCVCEIWHLLNKPCRDAVVIVEAYVDGLASKEKFKKAKFDLEISIWKGLDEHAYWAVYYLALIIDEMQYNQYSISPIFHHITKALPEDSNIKLRQQQLFDDIFGE